MDYTTEQINSIAAECAGFAHDNYDPEDTDGFNGALLPEAIWEGWHSRDGIDAPDVPIGFALTYWHFCEFWGGPEFADAIRSLSAEVVR